MRRLSLFVAALALHTAAAAAPTSVLFVGNSYTFGRVDPAMSYNAAQVRDLTAALYAANMFLAREGESASCTSTQPSRVICTSSHWSTSRRASTSGKSTSPRGSSWRFSRC